jgi:hypothetical protein
MAKKGADGTGGQREPTLALDWFEPGPRLRQRPPRPPAPSPPRSAFISEFVANTAASIPPAPPAANAGGAMTPKPPKRKVKFSRHVHGRVFPKSRQAAKNEAFPRCVFS